MGDVENVEEIAENLEMNAREKARYQLHIEDIRHHSNKVIFWRFWNIVWQIIFFWNIVAFAFQVAREYSAPHIPALSDVLGTVIDITSGITIFFGVISGFAFFLMIWTGIIRSKWENQLTRSTAYCLSFLSNIEHREFMQLEADEAFLKRKARAEANPEFQEKAKMLKKAMMERKISHVTYNRNLRMLQETYGKADPPSRYKKEHHHSLKKK